MTGVEDLDTHPSAGDAAPQLGERAVEWAATMSGHEQERSGRVVALAHADSSAALADGPLGSGPLGSGPLGDRRAREELEERLLAPGATRARDAGDRLVPEAPDPRRTCFERDRDRILHSTAFRRLAGKTQVFVLPEDHQRTRLTHALEVAQVAVAIARAVGANVALTEAIALGHDCGHGPGGHASEDAFSPYVDGGYDHATWGADVVLAGLNLCRETLDGIRNHSWSRPSPSTPEGEIVSWADRIAYVCHDFEDAVHVGITHPDRLPEVVRDHCGDRRSRQLHTFIDAVVDTAGATGRIGMDRTTAGALAAFRRFNYEHIYMRPASLEQSATVIAVLRALVEHLAERPGALPPPGSGVEPPEAGSSAALTAAVTYVGGMTDRYAFSQAVDQLGWDPASLPPGIG